MADNRLFEEVPGHVYANNVLLLLRTDISEKTMRTKRLLPGEIYLNSLSFFHTESILIFWLLILFSYSKYAFLFYFWILTEIIIMVLQLFTRNYFPNVVVIIISFQPSKPTVNSGECSSYYWNYEQIPVIYQKNP